MIDLRRLTALRAIARYGTVTAAAASLHLTPSAASQQMRQLSRDVGAPLLEPYGRRVRLTPAAWVLLRHAERMEDYWQQAEAELATTRSAALSGTLRLAGFPTAVSILLAPVAAQLQHVSPTLTVEVREAEPADCFDLLFSGDTDLAVVEATADNPPLSDAAFAQHPLFDDPFELLTCVNHPLVGRPSVAFHDLAEESWVVGFPGDSARQLILAACNSVGFSPAIAHQAREWSAVASLVANGLGIALIPATAALPPHPQLIRTSLAGSVRPVRQFVRVVRSGSDRHPAISAVASLLDGLAAEHEDRAG
ncbi:LysR family transcriptional regulator [Streptomyces sp. 8L]|uniref:LysR family transcriptional regulator n=1 Tax=Streptomyces sp. 8L TaxID=2877242 RepID=UPI001CD6D15F|nr:LysR family transcriptional regulator [Streptomyces sp. 8L]MCA1221109.1 LysR family transcriptional regulator [Streptomyces sp. 8L]